MKKIDRTADSSPGLRNNRRKAFPNYGVLLGKGRAGVLIAAWLLFSSHAPELADGSTVLSDLGCNECHMDLTGSVRDSSLIECPRFSAINRQSEHSLAEAPDSFLISNLADGYDPVCFEHRSHAKMAEMGNRCTTCHHYCPARGVAPCDECHGSESQLAGLIRADLEEACHHVCLGCHREWNRETRCDACHARIASAGAPLPYPAVPAPARKVFSTSFEQYPIVTFQHVEHIELFEFSCSDCHRQLECARCHDPVRRIEYVESQAEIRAVCAGCHDTGNGTSSETSCTKCHDAAEKPLIFHPIVGYEIPCFWKWLTCSSCHP